MILAIAESRKWSLHLATFVAGGIAVALFAVWANFYQAALYTLQGMEFYPDHRMVPCDLTDIRFGRAALAGSVLLRLGLGLWAFRRIRSYIRADRWSPAVMLLPLFLLMGVDLNVLPGLLLFHLTGIDLPSLTSALLGESALLGRAFFGSTYPVTVAMAVVFGFASVRLSSEIVDRLHASRATRWWWLAMVLLGILIGCLVWLAVVGRILSALYYYLTPAS